MNRLIEDYRSQPMQLLAALKLSNSNKAMVLFEDNSSLVVEEREDDEYSIYYINENVLTREEYAQRVKHIDMRIRIIGRAIKINDCVWYAL